MRSTNDGASWSAVSVPTIGWGAVSYGGGVFVATSSAPAIRSGDGGVTWTAIAPTESGAWNGLAYASGIFVAVSNVGTYRVARKLFTVINT